MADLRKIRAIEPSGIWRSWSIDHLDADPAVDELDARHPSVVHAQVGDLGVGRDAGGRREVAADLVRVVDGVERDDVAHRPHAHDAEDAQNKTRLMSTGDSLRASALERG